MSQADVMELLEKQSPLSAIEIKDKLGLSFPAINHSLRVMVRYNEISVVGTVQHNRSKVKLYAKVRK